MDRKQLTSLTLGNYPTTLNHMSVMTTTVNQVVILLYLLSGTWIIPFGTDRVVTPPPVAMTTDISHGSCKSYLK